MKITPIAPMTSQQDIEQELLIKAEKVCIESAKLVGSYSLVVINEIKELLRITNSYYSNRIESEGTHPINIEKAMKKEYSSDSKEKNNQKLSIAHINTQVLIDELLKEGIENPFSKDILKYIHKKFYSQSGMEAYLDINNNGTIVKMVPGEFRKLDVAVGNHVAISCENLDSEYIHFDSLYSSAIKFGTKAKKLVYILSSHHRLTWLHTFLDGNGRTSRLAMDMLFQYIDIEGYGLWNISRGLARKNVQYKTKLAYADEVRISDYDGRGNLTNKGLSDYVHFMLDVCLDQIEFMSESLKTKTLGSRIEAYVKALESGMLREKPLPKNSEKVLKELLFKGEVSRGEVAQIIGKKDRTASQVISELIERKYIKSDTPKGKIRINFNAYFSMKIFPELFPEI